MFPHLLYCQAYAYLHFFLLLLFSHAGLGAVAPRKACSHHHHHHQHNQWLGLLTRHSYEMTDWNDRGGIRNLEALSVVLVQFKYLE